MFSEQLPLPPHSSEQAVKSEHWYERERTENYSFFDVSKKSAQILEVSFIQLDRSSSLTGLDRSSS